MLILLPLGTTTCFDFIARSKIRLMIKQTENSKELLLQSKLWQCRYVPFVFLLFPLLRRSQAEKTQSFFYWRYVFLMRDFLLFCIFGFPKIEIHFQVSAPASQAEALIKMEDSEPFFQVLSANLQKNTFGASFTKYPPPPVLHKKSSKVHFSVLGCGSRGICRKRAWENVQVHGQGSRFGGISQLFYNDDINTDLFKASMRKQEATLNQRLVSAQDTLQTIREKGMDMYKVISHKRKK